MSSESVPLLLEEESDENRVHNNVKKRIMSSKWCLLSLLINFGLILFIFLNAIESTNYSDIIAKKFNLKGSDSKIVDLIRTIRITRPKKTRMFGSGQDYKKQRRFRFYKVGKFIQGIKINVYGKMQGIQAIFSDRTKSRAILNAGSGKTFMASGNNCITDILINAGDNGVYSMEFYTSSRKKSNFFNPRLSYDYRIRVRRGLCLVAIDGYYGESKYVAREWSINRIRFFYSRKPGSSNGGSGGYNNQLRLVDFNNRITGRLEIYKKGRWGTACLDYFNMKDAKVACTQLGFPILIKTSAVGYPGPSKGVGPIWLDDIRCKGSERKLSQCPGYKRVGKRRCNHNKDVVLTCAKYNIKT